ncbi:MAG TPA: hypothetical protein VMF69_06300 [Gemmataceae bacterium]|nr:hypothetical protein [Gemmataceae bacterium]
MIGGLGLMLWLVSAGVAQEPAVPGQKQPPGTKRKPLLQDAKSLADRKGAEAAADLLENAYQGHTPPEGVRMLIAALRGSTVGPGVGWFGPAQTRYSWKRLAGRCGVDPTQGSIPPSRLGGSEAWFRRLDRNKDGVLTPDDLDWSYSNTYVQMSDMLNRIVFKKLNRGGNGQLTKDELLQFFDKAAKGKDYISADDFRDAFVKGSAAGPRPDVWIRGLFAGDLGSMNEGPKLNEPAPDFTLKTPDGKDTIQLSKRIGVKPIVLVFGSFT